MGNKKKIKALAKHIELGRDEIEHQEDNLFEAFYAYNDIIGFYVLTEDEMIEKEYETFVSCYYGEYKWAFEKGLLMLMSHGNQRWEDVERHAGRQEIDTARSILENMICSPREVFEKSNFIEDAKKQYTLVDSFYICQE
jgi:hypothetical protein